MSAPDRPAPCGTRIGLSDALARLLDPESKGSVALFGHGSLVAKMYAPSGVDPQQPHTRDEAYVVAQGTGEFVYGDRRTRFGPGDFLFAAAGLVHRFENFSDDLAVWVLFYGPEGGETA